MNSISHIFHRIAFTLTACIVTILIFLVFSVFTTFEYWPWTTSTTFQSGTHYGFVLGSSKADTLNKTIELQRAKKIGALSIFEQDKTYDESYHGVLVKEGDLPRLSSSDTWHVGLEDCNCWLLLDFHNGRLFKITNKIYRGPVE